MLVLDADGDGNPDLLVWSRTGILAYRNGDERFTDTGLADVKDVISVAAGDFDNDGLPDLCVLTETGAHLCHNVKGRFQPKEAHIPPGTYSVRELETFRAYYVLDFLTVPKGSGFSGTPLVPVQEPTIHPVHGVPCALEFDHTDQMMRAAYRWLMLVPVLIGVSCWAQDDQAQKPVCNSENRGMTWPERISGHDRVPVEMCSVHLWKYKWRQLTVDVSDLVKGAKPHQSNGTLASAPPALVAQPSPVVEQSSVGIAPEPSRR